MNPPPDWRPSWSSRYSSWSDAFAPRDSPYSLSSRTSARSWTSWTVPICLKSATSVWPAALPPSRTMISSARPIWDFSAMDIYLLEAIINGLLLGGVLALLALGLNLIFGVIDVVWIAYADLVMCGMYAVYWLHVYYGWPIGLACAAAIVFVAI